MQRSVGWSVCVGWVLLAACSGEGSKSGLGDRNGGINSPPTMAGTGGAAPGAGGTGAFGNSDGGVPQFLPTAGAGGGGGAPAGDGGMCVVGQFCPENDPDPDHCGTLEFQPDVEIIRTPGNILIVFDQSMSMEMPWGNMGQSKIQAASGALIAALTPLQDLMTAASIFLPQRTCLDPFVPEAMNNSVDPIETAGQLNFMPAPAFLTAWNAHWTAFVGGQLIGTPLQEGFDRANAALTTAMTNQTLTGSVAVVAFTDGEPNCIPDSTMVTTVPAEQHAANWLTMGIKTYVVGLPGAMGAQTLTNIATAGGTMNYIDPSDPAALEMKLREIVQETVKTGFNSCSMKLTPVPAVPDELLMIVNEPGVGVQQVPRDRGWSLTVGTDDASIEITGALCDAAMGGRFESIKFQYACPESPPPPALPPVE
jgi:hypothetical protein